MNLVMFGLCVSKDPVTFEEASKSQTWSKACSSQNQHNQTHCGISTNTLYAKFKLIPKY
jgi:invasion protein IalB